MTNLRELYQEVILEHNKNPRNFEAMCSCTQSAHGDNPLCGDSYDIYLNLEDNIIQQISFTGHGCAISKAAASMMTSKVKGLTTDQAQILIQAFRNMLTSKLQPNDMAILGHLKVFQGVAQLPQRIKCAVLPWHTLAAALNGEKSASTQEEG